MEDQKIYILLTDTGTILTRMIKLYTRKPYNHASISFDPYLYEVYSFGRKTARNPFIGGFVRENIRGSFFQQARCAIYSCSVTAAQLQKMKWYIRKMEAQKHLYHYNLLGLFAITMNKEINRKNSFFCSQFVATVLSECNIVEFSKPLSHVTPHDLTMVDNLQLVYQGNLEEFHKNLDLQSSIGSVAYVLK